MDDSFVKAPVSVPKLSGFDKSFQNILTSKVGTITPILVDELIPGSRVNLRAAISASLPPLASDTFMRCSIKCEAFFVPMRLLCGSFESFFTDNPKRFYEGSTPSVVKGLLPVLKSYATGSNTPEFVKDIQRVGGLADYLNYKSSDTTLLGSKGISAMPFLAYWKIWEDWYRNSLVQTECFLPAGNSLAPSPRGASTAAISPFTFFDADGEMHSPFMTTDAEATLANGVRLTQLAQRNFGLDYFTTATPQPQQGASSGVSFATDGPEGQFSIAALRSANSLQQFKERNNLLGNLYVEQIRGRYGVRPSDGVAQRSIYLGRAECEVYTKGIFQSNSQEDISGYAANPFGTVGARYGSAYASGDQLNVNFTATECGYFFVMATLVPRVTYSSGVDRMLTRYVGEGSLVEMANPILQNVGPEPIYNYELASSGDHVFGYTDRYGSFKIKHDQLHGLLRDGQSLQSFALQRTFGNGSTQTLNSAFLEIPTNYMDQVTAVSGWLSEYGYILDSYFDYKVSMPLSKYALPSLQDPAYEHGETIVVSKGGSKL
ncbi:putative VP1 [Microviridae sp.]|nr:putative VP1 [Microviridae sp.]